MSHKIIEISPSPVPTHTQGNNFISGIPLAEESITFKSQMNVHNDKNHFIKYLCAGGTAGIMEHCAMYPIDSIKTRMQSLRPHPNAVYRNVKHATLEIIKKEGFRRVWRGLPIVAMGAGPAHAFYFTSYEYTKKLLNGRVYGGEHVLHGVAGAVATFFHDAAMNPAEVIKQRLQIYNSPYKRIPECAKHIYKTEGFRAFYRSFPTNLTMNLPFHIIQFMTYEYSRTCMMTCILNSNDDYNPLVHLISGAIAGGVAAACTSPLDVAKTLLNTQEKCVLMECSSNENKIRGMWNALSTIKEMHGWPGYFRGMRARVMFQVPSTALSWGVYEFFKWQFGLQISDEELVDLTS